jgi:hypothetical protein
MAGKPRAGQPAPEKIDGEPGHLSVDDRGNVTWEWADDETLLADDTFGATARLQALTDPSLAIRDDDDDPLHPATVNAKGLVKGYNPYNSGALAKDRWKRKKDLRALSKWLDLRRRMAQRKDEG